MFDKLSFIKTDKRHEPAITRDDIYVPEKGMPPDTHDYVKPLINGRPYIEIIEPFLRECAEHYYKYRREGFWYLTAEKLYENFLDNKEGRRDCVALINVYYVFDACQPVCVIVNETENAVKWSAFSHTEPPDSWECGELPIFMFGKEQYNEALAHLKAIVDEGREA